MTLSLAGLECWVRAGWTMLHFLWIGALVGLGAWGSKWSLRSASAHVRYLAALGWLAVLAVLPVAIAVWVEPARTPETPPGLWEAEHYPVDVATVSRSDMVTSRSAPGLGSESPSARPSVRNEAPTRARCHLGSPSWTGVATALPWIWVLGSPLVFAWSMAGLAGAERLRRLSSPLGDRQLDALCRRLARSLKISREVSIRVCARIASPLLVGIVRPMILLPPALLSALTPEQMEMLLLHELAHVRRWDNLVNFVQRLIESLLFFHPAVWLVSRWVRQEREHCCDELVLGRLGDRESYAETLLAVVRRGTAARRFELALAAVAGGPASAMGRRDVRSRIDRILRWEDETMQVSRRLGLVVHVALLAAIVIGGTLGLSQGRAGPREEPAQAVPCQAERKDSSQEEGSQQGPVDTPDHGVSRSESGSPAKPATRHPGGVNLFLEDSGLEEVFFLRYRELMTAASADSRRDYPGTFSPYSKIVLPYELGVDCLLNQDPTISPLYLASASSAPDTSAEPRAEEAHPKAGDRGAVRWVDQRNKVVWINLGRKDGLERGTEFRVYDRAKKDGPLGEEKGAIVVTRILADHLSEARIEQDRPGNPIMPGDSTGALRQEVEELRKELRRLQQERDELFNERVRLTDELHALQAERLKFEQGLKAPEESEKPRRPPGQLWPRSLVPGLKVDGLVLDVGADRCIEISVGSDDGLPKGQGLVVYRHGEGTIVPVGRVEVIETRPDRAFCRILGEFPHKSLRKGDRVAVSLPAGGVTVYAPAFPAEGGPAALRPPREPDTSISGTISIDATGEVTVDRAKMTLQQLADSLSAAQGPFPVRILITAHPETKHECILEVIETFTKAGIRDLSIVVQSDEQDAGPPASEPKSETLNIDAAGQITVNGARLTLAELREALQALSQGPEGKGLAGSEVLVVAHPDANHERVVEVLDACAQAGIAGVRLAVAGDEEPTRPLPVPRGEPKSPVY